MRRRVNSAPSPDNRTVGRRRGGFRALLQEMAAEVREHRSTALVYVTLRVLIIVTMVLQFRVIGQIVCPVVRSFGL